MRPFNCAILDDDPDWTDLIRRALDRPGLSLATRSFTDPEEALEALQREPVDIVISDLRMPKLDGFTFTRELRGFNATVPVIIVSSDILSPDEIAACGANQYVPKRILNTELATAVRALLLPDHPSAGEGGPSDPPREGAERGSPERVEGTNWSCRDDDAHRGAA